MSKEVNAIVEKDVNGERYEQRRIEQKVSEKSVGKLEWYNLKTCWEIFYKLSHLVKKAIDVECECTWCAYRQPFPPPIFIFYFIFLCCRGFGSCFKN